MERTALGALRGSKLPLKNIIIIPNLSKKLAILPLIKKQQYSTGNILILRQDKGDPSLSSETRIIVDVEDVGDNPPVFNPSSKYEVKINENLPLVCILFCFLII